MHEPSAAAEPELRITRAGTRTVNVAPAEHFTGDVKVGMLFTPAGPDRTSAGMVSFCPVRAS